MIVSLWFLSLRLFGFAVEMGRPGVDASGIPFQFRLGFTCVNGDTCTVLVLCIGVIQCICIADSAAC